MVMSMATKMLKRNLVPSFITVVLLTKSLVVLGSSRSLRKVNDGRDLADEIPCDDFTVYYQYDSPNEDSTYDPTLVCVEGSFSYEIDTDDSKWADDYLDEILQGTVDVILPEGAELMDNGHINLNGNDLQFKNITDGTGNVLVQSSTGKFKGIRTVLFVRVMMTDPGFDNRWSEKDLSDSAFDVPISLASQYLACSYEKLHFIKANDRELTGTNDGDETDISNGVTTVRIPYSPHDAIVRNSVTRALEENFGVYLPLFGSVGQGPTALGDHIMFCHPPGGYNYRGIAYAYIDRWMSVYSSSWCLNYIVQMHEIGHNIRLSHSNERGIEYADTTGVMGYSSFGEPSMCFNAAKSFQVGWYDDKAITLTYNGIGTPIEKRSYFGRLFGISEYGIIEPDEKVLIKLEVRNPYDYPRHYFIAFNARRGINSGTRDAINSVAVVQQNTDPWNYDDSSLLAKLRNADESYNIRNFDDNYGTDATITVTKISIDEGYADVEVCIGPAIPTVIDLLLVDEETNRFRSAVTDTYRPSIIGVSSIGSYGGFNIMAQVSNPESVLYVKFTKGGIDYQTESRDPYALCGDDDGNYKPCPYTCNERWDIIATPYYMDCFGNIVAGTPLSAGFVVECISSPPTPSPTIDQARFNTKVIGFQVINSDTNLPIDLIGLDSTIIVPGLYGVPLGGGYIDDHYHGLNFEAILDNGNAAGSVVTWLDGVRRTENVYPYSFCGDWKRNYFSCPKLCGVIELTAKVCSLRYGRGECSDIVSASVVIDCAAPPTAGPTPPAVVTDQPTPPPAWIGATAPPTTSA